jgi:7-methyl-GTP pyrophosphatase
MPALILASTSRYRRTLLARLGLPFTVADPGVAETLRAGEAPRDRAARLAHAKAAALATPRAVVIGADQVAALGETVLHKPGTFEKAVAQLVRCQGRTVDFYTAVTVRSATGEISCVDHTRVYFKTLPAAALTRYVALENPVDCAGGFKAEGLGIALFEQIESSDPTALIGLPMIWLATTLAELGFDPLK